MELILIALTAAWRRVDGSAFKKKLSITIKGKRIGLVAGCIWLLVGATVYLNPTGFQVIMAIAVAGSLLQGYDGWEKWEVMVWHHTRWIVGGYVLSMLIGMGLAIGYSWGWWQVSQEFCLSFLSGRVIADYAIIAIGAGLYKTYCNDHGKRWHGMKVSEVVEGGSLMLILTIGMM